MFKQKEEMVEDISSFIGENIKVIGNIEGRGTLRINGIVEGDINFDGNIFIGDTGSVLGNVNGNDISLAGTINGNVVSEAQLIVFPTGILIGNVEVANFIIQENAKFDGTCKMTNKNIKEINEKDKIEKKV